MRIAATGLALVLALTACSSDSAPDDDDLTARDGGPARDAGAPRDAGLERDGGPERDATLARLESYLLGDFDNQAQFDDGFGQLVERHVCEMLGLPASSDVVWLYVEHVEHVAQGRDAYFIRVNELRMVGDTPVSKAYRFPDGHPLRTNAFTFNGPRDACFDTAMFGDVELAELDYRAGCDVTFTANGDRFEAVSPEETCTFPGGWIQTISTVWADGMDSRDRAVTPQGESGTTFEFRRVEDFTPPGG